MPKIFRGKDVTMKKTQLIDALRNIRKRFVSFLSIVFIIMLGTGSFFMARYTARGIAQSASEYYRAQNFKDYDLASSIGITDSDLEKLRSVEGVTEAEGAVVLSGRMYDESYSQSVQLVSWTEHVSVPYLTEGEQPSGSNECAIGEDTAKDFGLKIGDTIHLSTPQIYDIDPLMGDTFTITALVDHPDYVRTSDTYTVILPLAAFNREGMENRYTRAFLREAFDDWDTIFDDSYEKALEPTTRRLRELLPELERGSEEDAKRLANERIDAEWAAAQAEIENARQQIASAEAELASKLASARAQLASAKAQLEELRQQLLNGEARLREAEEMLAAVGDFKAEILSNLDVHETLAFFKYVIALIDGYDYAQTPEEREIAYDGLQTLVNAPENADKAEVYRKVYHSDLRQDVKNPANFPTVKRRMTELGGVLMLAEAADLGISPTDVLSTIARLYSLLEEFNLAPDEAARAAVRDQIREFVSDPIVSIIIALADQYFDLHLQDILNIILYNDTYDEAAMEQLRSLAALLRNARDMILNAEALSAQGRAQLNAGWAMYNEGLRQLSQKEQEVAALAANARAQIEDAKRQLEEKIREAEAQLAEARAQANDVNCSWISQDRTVNYGYFSVISNVDAATSISVVVGGLFLLVAAMVCFSTLVIIIEEERKLVGTTKAFGFKNNEILAKYLIFGITAAALGALLGVGMGVGITLFVENLLNQTSMYIFPVRGLHIEAGTTIIVCIGAVALCGAITTMACTDLLKTSAYNLMSGTSGSSKKKRNKVSGRLKGSLYSRLVLRNMLNEKARVFINIVIIASGCVIVGVGFSMKYAFSGMTTHQLRDITVYDYRIDFDSSSETEENLKQLEERMTSEGVSFMKASFETARFEESNKLRGINLLCADGDQMPEYFRVLDPKTNKPIELPDDGILIQDRIRQVFHINPGDVMKMYDGTLNVFDTPVKDTYQYYIGRMAICTEESYRVIFGKEPTANCYYANLNGMDGKAFESMVTSMPGTFTAESSDYFMENMEGSFLLYNVIVIISIAVAVIMTFIILTNLANIFLNRKKKELIVMRINGFSIRETINYLAKETVLTSVSGVVLGLLIGILITPSLLTILEPDDCQFILSTHWNAWVIALLMECGFIVLIYTNVFRKVFHLDFHEIM